MKSARFGWILALAVAALAIGWWATRERPHAPEAPPTTKEAQPAPVKVELAQPAPEAASATRATAAADTVAVTPRPESPDDWIVLVVDASSQAPVAGAQVAWSSKFVRLRDNRRPLVRPDPESCLDPQGRWIETDERGLVRLPPDALPGLVCARHGAAFGSTTVFERSESRVRVDLRRALHLDIQVVDADGKPVAGVPVSLRAAAGNQASQPIWTGITEGDLGIARARHFENGLAQLRPPFDLVAGFEFPTRTASTVPVDVEHLPLEALRLVLPPAGSVEVLVHDAQGGPVPTMSLELNVTTAGETNFAVTPYLRQFQPASVEKGRVLYPFVETGLGLSAQAVVNMVFLHASGPGPRVNGERVTFDIDAGPAKPWLVGRLVDEAGRPLVDADVTYGLECTFTIDGQSRMGGGGFLMRTTALGRFEVLSPAEAQVPLKGQLSFRSFAGPAAIGLLKIDGTFHEGLNDVGDIVVRGPTVLVTGRMVDEQGAAVVGGYLEVEVETRLNGTSTWERDKGTTVTCNETGAFKVVSTSPHLVLRLRARNSGYIQPEPCQVTAGARDVKITLMRAGEISGSVIVEPDIAFTEITVFARACSEPDLKWNQSPFNERVNVRADGTFSLTGVRPLLFDLAVRRSGMKEPLVVVPNLDLRGGGPAKDPRLSGIDLRGLVRNARDERKLDASPR